MRAPVFIWEEFPSLFRGRHRALYRLEHSPVGIAGMRVDHADDRTYFTDRAGERWRVHDVSFGSPYAKPHHYHRFACGDQRATSRVFVAVNGARRSYAFARGESRDLSVERCAAQHEKASYLADARFDAKARGPR